VFRKKPDEPSAGIQPASYASVAEELKPGVGLSYAVVISASPACGTLVAFGTSWNAILDQALHFKKYDKYNVSEEIKMNSPKSSTDALPESSRHELNWHKKAALPVKRDELAMLILINRQKCHQSSYLLPMACLRIQSHGTTIVSNELIATSRGPAATGSASESKRRYKCYQKEQTCRRSSCRISSDEPLN